MISHFICVVLLAIFNIRYRYRVPFFLDECGFNDLAKNMSCIIEKPKVYFKRYKWYRLKTLRVCKSKHRLLIALFHWRCKSAAIRQSSTFDKVCGCRIYRKAYFRQCGWHCLKTLRVCLTQTRVLTCARVAHECNSFQN